MILLVASACSPDFDATAVEDPAAAPATDSGDWNPGGDPEDDDDRPPGDTDSGPREDSGRDVVDNDGDGYPAEVDCNDESDDIHPGARDAPYDGIDSDCDGADDYDQDGDGHRHMDYGGDDCDDREATTHPGAEDPWYDGVDSDCANNDDFDQDGDGEQSSDYGGDDCDDTDPSVWSGGIEVLGDTVDSDCDGDPDSSRFDELDTWSASGVQGPRLGESAGYAILTYIADDYVDPDDGSTVDTVGVYHLLDVTDLDAGEAAQGGWYWGDFSYDTGMQFWADDDWWAWGYGFHDGTTRWLLADVLDVSAGTFAAVGTSDTTTQTFDDVDLVEDTDGSLHLLGCDSGGGRLAWIHGDAGQFYNNRDLVADSIGSANGDACTARVENGAILVSARGDGELLRFTYSDTRGLESASSLSGYAAYDIEGVVTGGREVFVAAEGSDGAKAILDGDTHHFTLGDVRKIAVDVDSAGTMYVAMIDGSTDAYLAWGDPASGFDTVLLDVPLPAASDIDVLVTSADEVIVAVRGNAGVTWAWWRTS